MNAVCSLNSFVFWIYSNLFVKICNFYIFSCNMGTEYSLPGPSSIETKIPFCLQTDIDSIESDVNITCVQKPKVSLRARYKFFVLK